MKLTVVLFCLVLFCGCSSIQQTTNNHAPVLLVQHPFPSVPISIYKPDYLLAADLLIQDDGTISDVKLYSKSGIKEWDSIAIATLRTWEYSPMKVDDKPVACWVHQKMKIRLAEPILYSLTALLFPTYEMADSVYNNLVEGSNFDDVAKVVAQAPYMGKRMEIGEVDIHQYSESIRSNLTNLSEGEFTKPIKYDDHYIIFKRLKKM